MYDKNLPSPVEEAPDINTDKIARLLVLVPAYNEEERIPIVVQGIRNHLGEQGDVLVVDDGSRDNTAKMAQEAGAIVIRFPFNLGYGVALKAGYRYALRHGYDLVLQMDADGQHDPSSILDLIEPVRQECAKVVIGSRYLGNATYNIPPVRRLGQWIFSMILYRLTGKKITDPTSGFQALHHNVLRLYVSEEFSSDYPDADVLLLLHYKGIEFKEVAATFHGANNTASMHAGLKPFYYIYKMLLSMFLVVWRYHRLNKLN